MENGNYKMRWCFIFLFVISLCGISFNSYASTSSSSSRIELNRISCGNNHSLLLMCDGTVWSWGANDKGQLGDGTTKVRKTPVQAGGLYEITSVAGGGQHSLALRADGVVFAWGFNDKGQLGNATNTDSKNPVRVDISNVIAIAAGDSHSVALRANGTVWTWGADNNGQLGDGGDINSDSNAPVEVTGLSKIIAIAAGKNHCLALDCDGKIWAWGANTKGQLGDGTNDDSNVPVQLDTISNVIAIACGGSHSLAVLSDGSLRTWGLNADGQLGLGNKTDQNTPQIVAGVSGIIALDGGGSHSLLVKDDGIVWACGLNASGQLGIGSLTPQTSFKKISSIKSIVAIAAGTAHSLALEANDSVDAWGENANGQVGNNKTTDQKKPVKVLNLTGTVIAYDGGRFHTLAVKSDGTVWAWGWNRFGQLGYSTYVDGSTPVKVVGLRNAENVAGGWWFSLALTSDGKVWSWGYNADGELGDGTTVDKTIPGQVIGLSNVSRIEAGAFHSLALKNDGTVWGWGYNGDGQLGDGTNTDRFTPVQVSGLTNIIAIACGSFHNLALKNDGTVWAWGWNSFGQLGDGTNVDSNVPVQVLSVNVNNITSIAAGELHSLVRRATDSTLWAWGYNGNGQLGNGTKTNSLSPVQVTGVIDGKEVACGAYHSLVLKADKTIFAWGYNGEGMLGDNTLTERTIPVLVLGETATSNFQNITSIDAGGYHSLAQKKDGTFFEWGRNDEGQLGNGLVTTGEDKRVPFQVMGLSCPLIVEAGNQACYAIKADGSVWGWGYNGSGKLGDGTGNTRSTPVRMINVKNAVAVSALGSEDSGGAQHTLVLLADGTIMSCGINTYGQLGDGTTSPKSSPASAGGVGFENVIAVSAGGYHSLALKSDGTVWAWGYNGDGELGDNTTVNKSLPVRVGIAIDFRDVIAIAAGTRHNLALKSDGSVWAWGSDFYGQIGDGDETGNDPPELLPVQISTFSSDCAVAIAAGPYESFAIKADGTVWGWGRNDFGQVGNNTKTHQFVPVVIGGGIFTNIVAVDGGHYHTLFQKADGRMWGCGYNGQGQLGDSTTTERLIPVRNRVVGWTTSISAGNRHGIARNGDSRLKTWGDNGNGQLGNGTNIDSSIPVSVNGM
ncbi:MAG: hypothetical protein U0586_14615 [Candidatus Brocadiaceae bacterium]